MKAVLNRAAWVTVGILTAVGIMVPHIDGVLFTGLIFINGLLVFYTEDEL